jgi:hypothetical protein
MKSPMADRPLYQEAVQIPRAARRAGFTIRSGVDCLIAAAAIRHSLSPLHTDRDFPAIARVTSLRLHHNSKPSSLARQPLRITLEMTSL